VSTLDLGFIGNCTFGALIDNQGTVVWSCLPRFDGDPVFAALLKGDDPADSLFQIELVGLTGTEQEYVQNTAVLRTVLHSDQGSIEIVDFAPRFYWRDRIFRPQTLIRRVRRISGTPRIRILLKPTFEYGAVQPVVTRGSNHIRYQGPDFSVRVTTDAPIDYVVGETAFMLKDELNFLLGPDETLSDGVGSTARLFQERTIAYWQRWSQRLALPLEWQDAVIRSSITLKLCTYEPTGAIVAAVTTSIPEAANSGRNWDYRYCWLRDAFFTVRALNSVGAVQTMDNYVSWLMNVVADCDGDRLQPVFGVDMQSELTESVVQHLPGYRSMGPVRIGNQAHEHYQYDVYGNVILGAVQAFFDTRLQNNYGLEDFHQLEAIGEHAFRVYNLPDAGMWELRSRAGVHTSSSLMCWAACDRLSKIATLLSQFNRAEFWSQRASEIKAFILDKMWSDERKSFVDQADGQYLDASVLLMGEVGFLPASDPRFVSTLEALEKSLADGPHMKRYEAADDFGQPEVGFNACAFWRLDALARVGRKDEAREIFEALLSCRNHLGLLSEDTDPRTGELWGNFPQTYSMVGIINSAMRLSQSWDTVV
jgi:GH15 family glucan-1,4-alpha-glucosidase